jgi:poly(3-hydroxyalkanoate) synthetase
MKSANQQFGAMAFLWPALMAESASEVASAIARELARFTGAPESRPPEPPWTTHSKIALELSAVRLRDFSSADKGRVTLVCAPFALHGATVVDFAPEHSLVRALQGAGIDRLFVTDWRSATPDMRFWSIDEYLATLNVLVDQLGGAVDLIGLCQGGWMALIYAARFPAKVRKLVLVGAPIDIAAGNSKLSDLAINTPIHIFRELVQLGDGRVLGQRLLQCWTPDLGRDEIHRLLESQHALESVAFRRLEARFGRWYAWTVDLPGTYYLQVVEQLFKENRLARGSFVALGEQIDLSILRCPLFLLAARDDDVAAPAQIFATEKLIDSARCRVEKTTAPCGHLGLFMGRETVCNQWPAIARWLQKDTTKIESRSLLSADG